MSELKRMLEEYVKKDLDKKIILLSGPRQCGKTTLSKQLFKHFDYLNYDDSEDRDMFIQRAWRKDVELVILDEVHKHFEWKRFLKGVYDTQGVRPRLLVTGSAKMDTYRKVGDSLAGRHFRYRLHPFDIKELIKSGYSKDPQKILEQLLITGGFPEPFLEGSESYYKKWRRSHIDIILRQDLVDLEEIRNIKSIEILIQLLRKRVGSPISYASLARDLHHSPVTVKKWLNILEQLYIIFSVTPYHRNIEKSILKAPKYYFYDSGLVEGEGERLENVVAASLLKNIHYKEDTLGDESSLHFIRTKEGKEVDFCIAENDELTLLEVKLSDANVSKNLNYFNERLKPKKAMQLVKDIKREKHFPNGINVLNLAAYLSKIN